MRVKTIIFMAMAFIVMLSSPALALSNIEISVSTNQQPSNTVSACPDSVITSDVLNVVVTNLNEETDTFYLTLDWIENAGFILPEITLASGESRKIEPLWLTVPYTMEPGTYTARIKVKSALTGEEKSVDIMVEVLRCRAVDILVKNNYQQMCKERIQPAVYKLTVTNKGKWDETFYITTDSEYAGASDETIYLAPGESKDVDVVVTPPEDVSGVFTVVVTARPTDPRFGYIKDTETLYLNMVDCYSFIARIIPEEKRTCYGKDADFTLVIENTGLESDVYYISSPDWIEAEEERVEVSKGERKEIKLLATPETTGIMNFTVEVFSQADKEKREHVHAVIISEECRAFEILQADVEKTACSGGFVENYTIQIKNTGPVENTINLHSSYGILDKTQIILSPGEVETVTLTAATPQKEGVVNITLTTSDGVTSKEIEMKLVSENCYKEKLVITPEVQDTCPYTEVEYTVLVENTGKLPDNITLDYGLESKNFILLPGESKKINVKLSVEYEKPGMYSIPVTVTSENVNVSGEIKMNVKPMDECYSVMLYDGNATVETGKAEGKAISIKNTGEVLQKFVLSVDGPEWVYVEPRSLVLEPGEEGNAYAYISPPYATPPGNYTVKITASSNHTQGEFEMNVYIPGEIAENVTENITPEKTVTLNVSLGENETGMPITGMAETEKNEWKTLVVAVIMLIIIIILAARFILLFR